MLGKMPSLSFSRLFVSPRDGSMIFPKQYEIEEVIRIHRSIAGNEGKARSSYCRG